MKADALSLRQVAVLTITALLAPVVDVMPGAVAGTGGAAGWLAPLFVMPILLLWMGMVCSALEGEGESLNTLARRGFGRGLGGVLTLLYIMWGFSALAAQVGRSARRLGAVYGPTAGKTLGALAVALALWLVWRKVSALCRAGEMFWLALGVGMLGLLALAAPQVEPVRLMPKGGDWMGLPGAVGACLALFAPGIFGAALVGKAPRSKLDKKRMLGWMVALCAIAALLIAAVVGQMGARLTASLPQAFFIMVQGLSLRGALARLEALAAALWMMADFAFAGLVLAGVRELAGEKLGRGMAVVVAAGAVAAQGLSFWEKTAGIGGLIFGFGVPVILWLLCKSKKRGK